MAPKKRSHGKDAATSSSTPPHFDRRRFWNEDAENNYNSMLGKNMHRERGVDTSLPNLIFLNIARNRQWTRFVQQPGPAVRNLVYEFYANLMVRHEGFKVRVRGRMVAFDSHTINTIYGMPEYEDDGYRQLMSGTVPYDEILRRLCLPGAKWKLNVEGAVVNFESKYLADYCYHWFVFITSRIMPSNHTSEVTKERAALLYCIFHDREVDLGRLIQSSILQAVRRTTTLTLPHTSLITELCRHAGVAWDDSEEVLQPRGMIDIGQRQRNRRGVIRDNPENVPVPLQIREATPPRASPPRASRTMDERMTALEHSWEQHRQQFEAHRRLTEEHMRFVHDFNAALSQRFPSSSSDHMPFPQPPTWPPHSRNPGDDDIDMGPGGGNEY